VIRFYRSRRQETWDQVCGSQKGHG